MVIEISFVWFIGLVVVTLTMPHKEISFNCLPQKNWFLDNSDSHWNMERSRKAESMQFWDAIHNETLRCKEALPYQHRIYSYVDRGFYMEQLRRLWHYFSKDNVLVLKNEYLRDQPRDCLNEIFEFLGVSDYGNISVRNVHSRPYVEKMSDKEKKYLHSLFEHEIKGLERFLKWDCDDWLSD